MSTLIAALFHLGATAGTIEHEIITFTSTHDQTEQPARFYPAPREGAQPLLVHLHAWSSDIDSYNPDSWVKAARAHGWHVAVPHFRGANVNPEACASPAARQDILDTVDAVKTRYAVDASRIYLAGSSGGGHMAMAMAAYSPETWTAVSAWVGISNLADWHAQTRDAGRKYYRDIEACVGGAPGTSAEADRELHARSPVFHLARARDVPLDLAAGIHDGHTGSVPIHHTLDAFNAVARAVGGETVPQSAINALSQRIVPPEPPVTDPNFERAIHLRAEAGKARVTIFEGGHEGLPGPACAWLAQHPGKGAGR